MDSCRYICDRSFLGDHCSWSEPSAWSTKSRMEPVSGRVEASLRALWDSWLGWPQGGHKGGLGDRQQERGRAIFLREKGPATDLRWDQGEGAVGPPNSLQLGTPEKGVLDPLRAQCLYLLSHFSARCQPLLLLEPLLPTRRGQPRPPRPEPPSWLGHQLFHRVTWG